MKIPETSANVGAYYGNEENGQWQPNGVMIDAGVGGGAVGSGDARVLRPQVYPVHVPRPHVPGYVMAGPYYPPAPYAVAPAQPQDDFEDYMWMENEEEFDKQVMQQLEEEALMEQCIEAMLEDEQRERHRPVANGHNHYPAGASSLSLEEAVSRSTLNPLAAEFVPTGIRPGATDHTEKKDSPVIAKSDDIEKPTEKSAEVTEAVKNEPTQPTEPPEVSAADVTPADSTQDSDKRPKEKDLKKDLKSRTETKAEAKRPAKAEPKQKGEVPVKQEVKVPAKQEVKVPAKKKEVKSVKSDVKVCEEKEESPVEIVKPAPLPAEEPPTTGFKPINYAAAARANKPKKPSPVVAEKPSPVAVTVTKTDKRTETTVSRKNSAK